MQNFISLSRISPDVLFVVQWVFSHVLAFAFGRKLVRQKSSLATRRGANSIQKMIFCASFFALVVIVHISSISIEPKLLFFNSLTCGGSVLFPLVIFTFAYSLFFRSESWTHQLQSVAVLSAIFLLVCFLLSRVLPSSLSLLGSTKSLYFLLFGNLILYVDISVMHFLAFAFRKELSKWSVRYGICALALVVDSLLFSLVIQAYGTNDENLKYVNIVVPQTITKLLTLTSLSLMLNLVYKSSDMVYSRKYLLDYVELTKRQFLGALAILPLVIYKLTSLFIVLENSFMSLRNNYTKGFDEELAERAIRAAAENWNTIMAEHKNTWIAVSADGSVNEFETYDESVHHAEENDINAFVVYVNDFCKPMLDISRSR